MGKATTINSTTCIVLVLGSNVVCQVHCLLWLPPFIFHITILDIPFSLFVILCVCFNDVLCLLSLKAKALPNWQWQWQWKWKWGVKNVEKVEEESPKVRERMWEVSK